MEPKRHRVFVINPGSTSTKFALFSSGEALFTAIVRHNDEELAAYKSLPTVAQLEFRMRAIMADLKQRGVELASLDAVVGRGGLLKPVASGTYKVNTVMLNEMIAAARGEHPSNLGAALAHQLASFARCPAYIVDPVSVDEWPPVARLSGMPGLDRECLSHALNTKAVAKRFAREQGRAYADLRLIVGHMGSGISVSAHQQGRMVDVTNSRDEGAFSTERAGGVPVMKLVQLCFSGKMTRKEIEARLFQGAGVLAYVGTRELTEILKRIQKGDPQAALVFDAMMYQIAKEIGAMATVLLGKVDAILLTGGMAHAQEVVDDLRDRAGWIAPVHVYPGEDELRALAEGALRVLTGEESAKEYM